jgi:hypothetical protein
MFIRKGGHNSLMGLAKYDSNLTLLTKSPVLGHAGKSVNGG